MPLAAHRFTVDEYHRMGEAGVLHEDDRVELIEGQVVQMTPIGRHHAGCVTYLNSTLASRAGARGLVSPQNPVILGTYLEPQPDLTILRPRADYYRDAHPEAADVLLLIEVADSSLDYDRGVKVPLYAGAGVPEVWIVNLPDDVVEVFLGPGGARYGDVRTARRGETVTPSALPHLSLRVDDILG
jgi:Uma2 family endonuclease